MAVICATALAQNKGQDLSGPVVTSNIKPAPAARRLPDPPASSLPGIIQQFSSKERLFRDLLKHNYTYTETIKVETVDDDGTATGSYEQSNDIQFTPDGQRQVVCTFCPQPTLKAIQVTQEDIDDFFNMDMYTVSVDELGQYDVRYVDHEPLDQLTTYVFDVRPKQLEKGHRYFQGRIWVDDRDLQIVKSFGKAVPDDIGKHGEPNNVFLPFETYRQSVDDKYWFPVYTHSDSMFDQNHVKIVIRFKDYKQFRATTRILQTEEIPNNPQPKPKTNTIPK